MLDLHAPLEGERVVSLAVNLPGPLAAARLHELGAEVITLIPPGGDPMQQYCPEWYEQMHVGMQIRPVNLKDAEELDGLHRLFHETDLLITATRPSALARLGLDWETLHRRHPHLCQISIVGHAGEDADTPGHDLTYQAVNGVIRPPDMPRTLIADLAGAERAVSEALGALIQRERMDGVGCLREVALADAAAMMSLPLHYGLTTDEGLLGGGLPYYAIYPAKTGYVALAALEPRFVETTKRELGVDGSKDAFVEAFSKRDAAEWETWAETHDVPLAAIHTIHP